MAKVKKANIAKEAQYSMGDTAEIIDVETESAKKKPRIVKNKSITYIKDPDEGIKFAPQCAIIVKHIKANNTITLVQLAEALEADPDFKTRQPTNRIIAYYLKDILNTGIITVTTG